MLIPGVLADGREQQIAQGTGVVVQVNIFIYVKGYAAEIHHDVC